MDVLGLMLGIFIFFAVTIPLIMHIAHAKEKKAKVELMRQHPQHAVEIQRAIDLQEARFQHTLKQPWIQLPPSSSNVKKGGGAGKFVVVALAVIYVISPIDFIPDVLPVLGWGDDVVAAIIGLRALIK